MTDIFITEANCAVNMTCDENVYITARSAEKSLESLKCFERK